MYRVRSMGKEWYCVNGSVRRKVLLRGEWIEVDSAHDVHCGGRTAYTMHVTAHVNSLPSLLRTFPLEENVAFYFTFYQKCFPQQQITVVEVQRASPFEVRVIKSRAAYAPVITYEFDTLWVSIV